MDTMLKRLLSLAVALFMVIGLMPWNAASVYATEEEVSAETPAAVEAVEEEAAVVAAGETHASAHYAGADVEWTDWNGTVTPLRNAIGTTAYFCLTQDATLGGLFTTENNELGPNTKLTICLHGHELKGNASTRFFRLSDGAEVTIVDCKGTGKLVPQYNIQGAVAGFWKGTYGNPGGFNMYDVAIDGSLVTNTNNGGVLSVGGIVTNGINIKGCTIENFTAKDGGAIYVNAANNTFNIEDTTFTNCHATNDGGVICTSAKQTINMTDCVIDGCYADNRGGAILGTNSSVITLDGCDFTDCTADNNIGGALYGNLTTYNISGCDFSGCNAYNGGAVYANNKSVVNVSDSTFIGNTAGKGDGSTNGGGAALFVWDATATIMDTEISQCNAPIAALYCQVANVTFGGTSSIKDCHSMTEGAGVRIVGGTFTMTGGEISGNDTTGTGSSCGGVVVGQYVDGSNVKHPATFIMTGGLIANNTCSATSLTSCSEVLVNGDSGAKAYLSGDATIIKGDSSEMKYAFRNYKGTSYISGDVTIEGICTGNGADNTVTIYGGTFTESYTSYVASTSTVLNKVKNDGADTYSFMAVCNHAGESETITKDATCAEAGVKTVAECQYCGEVNAEVEIAPLAHTVEHVAESCYNIEHWACSECGACWLDEACTQVSNQLSVIKAEASHNIEAVAESCYNTAYWYCDACETYWADEALTQITNSKNVIKAEATHALVHVEATAATCTENGNIEHWYCEACETVWADEALTQITNHMSVVVPAAHTYDDNCDSECNVCEEFRWDTPHNLTTFVEAVVPANCQEEGHPAYWICEDCGAYFRSNTDTSNELNPAWMYYTGEHVRPEGAAACADVDCELCDEISYGDGSCERPEGTPVCQEANCIYCGNAIYPWDHSYGYDEDGNSLAPLCGPGTCIYCEQELEYIYEHENGSYAACSVDGECVYGCGKQYPATGEHQLDEPCLGGQCWMCWEFVEPVHGEIVHVEAKAASCYEEGNIEHWYCADCGQAWLDADKTLNTNLKAVILPMAHGEIVQVEAKAASCYEEGNIEHWYCADCGQAWLDAECTLNTNLKAVILPMAHGEITHVEAKAATCFEEGNIEYWYCEACGQAWLDAECTLNTNLKAVILPMAHGELTHVEAKAPTYEAEGNIEYWYCEACGYAWLDAEGTLSTNLKSVILPKLTGVAEANGDAYDTLAEAVAVGGEVKLLTDIALTESIKVTGEVTVDLNGKKLTGPDDGKANWYAFIVDGGDLTLKDSIGTGELWAKCYGVETKGGSFTMESGKITATNNKTVGTAVVNYGGTVTINGGELSGELASVSTGGHFAVAETVINGGTLTGTVSFSDYNAKGSTVKSVSNIYETVDGYAWISEDGLYVLSAIPYVAAIGETKYVSLAAAVEAAEAGATVTLLGDATGAGVVIDKDITIDLGGYTYTVNETVGSTGTTTLGLQILKDNNVTIKNGTLTSVDTIEGSKEVKVLIQNYANLTLIDVNLVDNTDHILYALSNNCGNTVLEGNTNITTDAVAFDVYDYTVGGYTLPGVTVNTTGTIEGAIEVSDTVSLVVNSGSYTDETVKGYVAYWQTINVNGVEYTNIPELPSAEVKNLGAMTINEEHYVYDLLDVLPNAKLTTSTDPFNMQVAMEFIALDTPEEAAANGYAEYTTDFFVKLEGIEGGSFVGDGCYLAGYYADFGDWVVIPLDGFTVQEGVVYPVITTAGFDFSYVDICTSVEDFICGIYFSEEVLEANPNLSVTLSLGLSETYEEALNSQFELVDDYTYSHDELDVCFHNVITHVEAKAATCFENGNIEYWYCEACGQAWLDEACTLNTNLKAVVLPMAHAELTHVEAKAATCYEEGNIEYWTCEACGYAWLDAEGTLSTNLKAVITPAAHGEITHVEAKAATCFENGNIEYWFCEACGQAWLDEACTLNTNLKAVILPMAHAELTHVEAKAATCYEEGNIEYWTCEACGYAWLDAEGTLSTNLKAVILPAAHGEITHVEAKEATCTELGNIEYWYCEACGQAWLDEACTLNTNLMAVKLPMADHEYFYACDAYCMNCGELTNPDAAHNITHVEAKAGTDCQTWDGNIEYWTCSYCNGCWDNENATGMPLTMMSIKVPGDHVYFNDCDPICMVCGEETRTVSHNVIHVDAVEGDCQTMGNVEYWYCDVCGAAWLDEAQTQVTNLMSVKTGYGEHKYFYACDAYCMNCGELTNEEAAHNMTHVPAKAGTDCQTWDGNIEYWTCSYCNGCWDNENATGMPLTMMSIKVPGDHVYFNDCDPICMVCGEETRTVSHNVIHVDAVEGDCQTMGNVEYWYCDVCGAAWLDEAQTQVTNLMSVKTGYGEHKYEDGVCGVCGEADPDYVGLFDFAGSTMELGNELVLNFVFRNADLTGTDNYAVATIARETGDATVTIPQSQWTAFNASMTQIPVILFAKEMTDDVTVIIYNAEGKQLSNSRTNSIVGYCNDMFNAATSTEENKVLAVDMLNYGAAAQIQFNYREETLANANLTDEQKAMATVVTDMQDESVKGPGCAGATLTLEEKILLNFVYQNATIEKAAYATVSYVDHYDQAVSYTIEAKDFLVFNSSMKMVQINTLVVADCRTMVTVELFDAEGNSMGISQDSVESYTARSGQDLFKAILAFGDSAYAKFH